MHKTKEIQMLKEKLQKNQIVFFAGSGIGYDSGLVDIFDVLGRTAEVFLPTLNNEQKDAIYRIQPELFYSILLVCSHNNNKCLDMWKCLNPGIWTVEYAPKPNFVHYFVAAYSYLAGVPIFTVNYDTMFEMACSELGIKDYEVLLEPPEHGIKHSAHTLKICKLHGSADFDANGDINPAVFKTTMSEISKVNEPWLEYILSFQQEKHFCFIGYSGRDIDYYPRMKQVFKSSRVPEPLWLMSQKTIDAKEDTFLNAERIGRTIIVNRYPNEVFPVIYEEVFRGTRFQTKMEEYDAAPCKKIDKDIKTHFLDELQAKIPKIHIDTELFWIVFSQRMSSHKELHKCLLKFKRDISALEKWEAYLFLSAKIRDECVHAQFVRYRETARELLSFASSVETKTPEDYQQIMEAKLQIISSYQMMIPAHLAFKIPFRYRKYGLALYVRFRFFLLIWGFRYLVKWKQKEFSTFEDATIVTVQEAELRAYAMDVKVNPKGCRKKLEDLKRRAGEKGNYTTFYGVDKYLNRISASKERVDDIERAVTMTYESSTESIAKRDLGYYREALDIAVASDDTLSIIKDLLGIAYSGYQKNRNLLSEEDKKLLLEKMGEVEAGSLSKAFSYIYKKYLA